MTTDHEGASVFHAYLLWHYRQGLREFFEVVSNLLWFVGNFFSFKVFYHELFSPISTLGRNPLSSFVGFLARILVMMVGVVSYVFVSLSAFLLLVVWVFAPAVLIGGLVLSVTFFAI